MIDNIIDEFVYNEWVEIILKKYCSDFFNKIIIDKKSTMDVIFAKLKPNISNYVIDEYTSNKIYEKSSQLIDEHNKNYSTSSSIKDSKSKLDKKLSNKEIIANLCRESYSLKLNEIEANKLDNNNLRNIYRLKAKDIEKQILKLYEKEYKEKLPIKEIYRKFN